MLRLTVIPLLALVVACSTAPTPLAPVSTPRPIPTLAADTPEPATATPTLVIATPIIYPTLAPTTPTPESLSHNPIGLMLGPEALGIERRVALVKGLGGAYFRPWDVKVDQWDGQCGECGTIERSGLKVLLTVRANGDVNAPTIPPKDLSTFKQTLAAILDKRQPEVLVVENEENSAQLFYAGTPNDYAVEERAACDIAHGRGVKCTNGGLASEEVVLLTWSYDMDLGRSAQGCAFARRALDARQAQVLCNARAVGQLPKALQDDLLRGRALLKVYAGTGADYLNFHWYVPDANALAEAVAYLRTATSLPVMSNEIGEQSDSADTPALLLQKALDLGLPYVIWYSVDSPKAHALTNADGSLRPAGDAFKAFMQTRFN